VVGERVLRLEQRLGYQHKGVEKLFIGADIARGARLVGRVSGDSTCAYAWAYADAVEAACGVEPPPRAPAVRALLLERERVANHLGDLGALGNDAAFAFGLTQFLRLKEDWVRLNASCSATAS
jgi:Ni,Fe-hydrogenase III large subunit